MFEPEWKAPKTGTQFVPPGEKAKAPVFSKVPLIGSKCGQYRHENESNVRRHEDKCRFCTGVWKK